MAEDWQRLDSAPTDGSMVDLYCPGISSPTKGVLQGCWNDRLKLWTLNPYGTVQFTTLYPSMWRKIGPPPAEITPGP